MLGAPTLGEAIERGIATIDYHSKGDILSLAVSDGDARPGYRSAAKGQPGYNQVALGSVGIMLSLCREFLPARWRPLRLELDFPRPDGASAFEDVFDCPVVFDAQELPGLLRVLRSDGPLVARWRMPPLTIGDIARARFGWGKLDRLGDIIAQQVWAQVLTVTVSIESAAASRDTSVRTLQRELNREGTTFRDLANS
jgi:hypothetical protein